MLMLLLFTIMLLLPALVYGLNVYVEHKTGIKKSLSYYKCEQNAWVAETAWLDSINGQVYKIVTTSHWQDGVISALSNGEKIYHTKQPCNTREGLHRYHRMARNQFFLQIKWKTLTAAMQNINVAYFKVSRHITTLINQFI